MEGSQQYSGTVKFERAPWRRLGRTATRANFSHPLATNPRAIFLKTANSRDCRYTDGSIESEVTYNVEKDAKHPIASSTLALCGGCIAKAKCPVAEVQTLSSNWF